MSDNNDHSVKSIISGVLVEYESGRYMFLPHDNIKMLQPDPTKDSFGFRVEQD